MHPRTHHTHHRLTTTPLTPRERTSIVLTALPRCVALPRRRNHDAAPALAPPPASRRPFQRPPDQQSRRRQEFRRAPPPRHVLAVRGRVQVWSCGPTSLAARLLRHGELPGLRLVPAGLCRAATVAAAAIAERSRIHAPTDGPVARRPLAGLYYSGRSGVQRLRTGCVRPWEKQTPHRQSAIHACGRLEHPHLACGRTVARNCSEHHQPPVLGSVRRPCRMEERRWRLASVRGSFFLVGVEYFIRDMYDRGIRDLHDTAGELGQIQRTS